MPLHGDPCGNRQIQRIHGVQMTDPERRADLQIAVVEPARFVSEYQGMRPQQSAVCVRAVTIQIAALEHKG